jgi:hypothetical protein
MSLGLPHLWNAVGGGSGCPRQAGSWALGIGAPLPAAVVWGMFAAPRAKFGVPLAGVVAVKALVFGAATVTPYAAVFAVLVLGNTTVVTVARS